MTERFSKALKREVAALSRAYGYTPDKSFLVWFGMNVLDLDEPTAVEAVAIEGPNDKSIDLFHVDHEDGRVYIVQAKYSSDHTYAAKERDVDSLQSSVHWLSSPDSMRAEGRPELEQAARDFSAAAGDGYGIELIYAYAGPRSVNVEKAIEVYGQNKENIERRRHMRHYHMDVLSHNWAENQGSSVRIKTDRIKLNGDPHVTKGEFGRALVGTVACTEISKLVRKYSDRLYERNVRLFLGARRGSVNAGIADTLDDPSEREYFWSYNNGITFVCDSFKQVDGHVVLSRFSIVNGGQTAASIANAERLTPGTTVLIRCIAASGDILDNITRYTNSQNQIRTWDIASQSKVQRRLKKEFSNLSRPYIYLTRRGDRPKGDLTRFREKAAVRKPWAKGVLRKIEIDVAGQYLAAFQGRPVLAYQHKAELFTKHHDDVFPSDIRVESVLFAVVCGEICTDQVKAAIRAAAEDEAGLFERRVLKRRGNLFVLAIMADILRVRNGSTYQTTLPEARITSSVTRDRLCQYAKYATTRYVEAVSDEVMVRGGEFATLIRQPEFFKSLLTRIQRSFKRDSLSRAWLDEAVPQL